MQRSASTNSADAETPPDITLSSENSQFPLLDVSIQLLDHRWKISKIVAGFIIVGVILCFLLPRRYTAMVKIMPPQQSQSGISVLANQLFAASGGSGSLAALAGGGLGLKNPNDIYIGILQSRLIADNIIRKYNLQSVYRAKDMTEARKKLKSYTDIVSEKSGVVSVEVTDTDKQRSAAIANTYIDELRMLTNSLSETEADRRLDFYSKRLDEKKEALDAAQEKFKEVEQNKSVFQPEAQGRATVEEISTLERQISAKEVQLKMLATSSTDDNPQVQLVSSELASLRQQLGRLQKQSFGKEASGGRAQGLPDASLAYFNAEHELRYRQTMFDLLSRQYDAAMLDVSKDASIIQVLEPAIAPDRKSFPHIGVIMALFALTGFLCGCGWVILLWKTEDLRVSEPYQQRIAKLRTTLGRKPSAAVNRT